MKPQLDSKKVLARHLKTYSRKCQPLLEEGFKQIAKEEGISVDAVRDIFKSQIEFVYETLKGLDINSELPEFRWDVLGKLYPSNRKIALNIKNRRDV